MGKFLLSRRGADKAGNLFSACEIQLRRQIPAEAVVQGIDAHAEGLFVRCLDDHFVKQVSSASGFLKHTDVATVTLADALHLAVFGVEQNGSKRGTVPDHKGVNQVRARNRN